LRRAGLDYRELACVTEHADLQQCLAAVRPRRVFALSTKGKRSVYATKFEAGDAFLLGPETRGLPDDVLAGLGERVTLRIPMRTGNRSLNLSNAAAIVVYEAWRQNDFSGGG
jgi:tRNA (cytidine/uridine-2'-O-)-methyltransferase